MNQFGTKHEAARLTGLSTEALKKYRLDGRLRQGVHWVRHNACTVRYNLPLLSHWQANIHTPEAHEVEIKRYLESINGGNQDA